MVQLNIVRSITCCLFWIILLVSITEVYNQNTTVYGYEGDTVILSCPLAPPPVSSRTTWRGPPSATVYFYNTDKNPSIDRGERLSVIPNTASGAYNLRITNLTIGVDVGMFSCEVNTNPIQQHFINLKLHIQQYLNLTGSSEYAFLGKAFTWTCALSKPKEMSTNYVLFKRNAITVCAGIGYINGVCRIDSYISNYTYKCLSENIYSLKIPADNMTKDENNSQWHCESIANSSYRSSTILLKIAIDVYNVSISPSDNPLTIRESTQMEVRCVVNRNAVPAPNITWYLGSTDITFMAGTDTTSITITGNRTDNKKSLECRASNSNTPPKTVNTTLNVEYPPMVYTLSQQDIIEGRDISVTCTATPGNPSSTTFYWTKVDNSGFRQNGATLQLPDIQRTSSGTYRCTAENNYSNGEKGTDSQSMFINVLYPPIIENRPLQLVNESDIITMTRDIFSNPLSNVSWYNTTDLLITQTSVKTASFTIERATCTDTMNYTLVASNAVRKMVTAVVELIVHCKPISDKTNITLGVTCTTGIEFSTTIIAYPEPHCELQYENGTRNNHMITTIIKNDVNNFTVQIKQDVVEKSSFGVYHLKARNMFGGTTVIVNVIEQRRPDHPRKLNVICEETGVRVQWISSFNGGEPQYFTVITLNSQDGTVLSYRFLDKGENEIHSTYITNLQPSVTYWFSVSAKNSHGSSSSNVTSCKTKHVKETASSQTGVVAGSVIGALMLVTIIIIIVICAHRQYTCIIGFEKKNRDVKVDTKKDASNYTSIKEQQDHTQRDMYGKLTPNEETNQYEAIRQTDNRGNNEQLYEQLQEKESIAKEGNSDNQNIPLKTKDSSDDKFVAQYAEEYMNTSFVK